MPHLKRLIDVLVALVLLTLFSPLIALLALFIYLYDFESPLYVAPRIGKDGGDARAIVGGAAHPDDHALDHVGGVRVVLGRIVEGDPDRI